MTEQEAVERFNQDIDDLLRRAEPAAWDAPPDYQRALDLARTLAASDHSAANQHRQALRQRLIARAHQQWEREGYGRSVGFWQHPLVALPLALVTLALVCALVLPSSAGWARIGQPELALPAIETPVAAVQTAYAEFHTFGADLPTSSPSPTSVTFTPTAALSGQSLPARYFSATGTPASRLPSAPVSH